MHQGCELNFSTFGVIFQFSIKTFDLTGVVAFSFQFYLCSTTVLVKCDVLKKRLAFFEVTCCFSVCSRDGKAEIHTWLLGCVSLPNSWKTDPRFMVWRNMGALVSIFPCRSLHCFHWPETTKTQIRVTIWNQIFFTLSYPLFISDLWSVRLLLE